jgi:hypothetical protein
VLIRSVQRLNQVNSPLISGILWRGNDQVQTGHEGLRAEMLAEMAAGKALPDSSIQKKFEGQVVDRGVQNCSGCMRFCGRSMRRRRGRGCWMW